MKRLGVITAALSFGLSCIAQHSPNAQTNTLNSPPEAMEMISRLNKEIPPLLEKSDVPGLSIALVRNGQLVWTGSFGISNANSKKPVTENTVFEAASLSKPVFAYAVLKLVDEGKLSLDSPLNKYLGNNYDVVNDDRINQITARHVLTHSSGFPNWRDADGTKTLLIHFRPGEKFSYSGEGMVYLSRVVEKITGMRFEEFMQHYALRPLGMSSSSYIWRNRYDSLKAYRHDIVGQLSGRNQPETGLEDTLHENGNAAASLNTTAGDYAKFIMAILSGTGLKKETWSQMLTPQISVADKFPPLAWGLGIGLEMMPEGKYIWHWGDNGDSKAFVTAYVPGKNAVVYFADGSNGLSFTQEILDSALGGNHPAVAYLHYDSYHSPAHLFTKSALAKGASEALKEYQEDRKKTGQMIDEESMNTIGYVFLRMKRTDEAILIFEQNTQDFPKSWNVWDSLGEAFAGKGDKEQAIKYYEKSLQLNPNNSNGAQMLKKLRQ